MHDTVDPIDAKLLGDESELTPDWLSSVLQRNGLLVHGSVIRVTCDQWKNQQVSRLFKVTAEYSPDAEPALPGALILKYTKPHKQSRRAIALAGREHRFYADVAPRMQDPPVPICFDSVFDKESGRAHLILEDLTGTHLVPDFPLPPTAEHATGIVDCLADIHGSWWGSDLLGSTIGRRKDQVWIDRREAALHKRVDEFLRLFGDNLSSRTRNVIVEGMACHRQLLMFQESGPVTITHGDAHSNNFLIPRNPDLDRTKALDWEFWDIEPGTNDLATLIGLNWYGDMREERERELIERYHDKLVRQGVDYDWDRCWDDYRRSIAKHVLTPIKQQGNGLAVRTWWPNLQRIVSAYQDLDCRELMALL